MKLLFFIIAFCLISFRFYLSWSGKDRESRGVSESYMKVKSGDFTEEIKYSGKFQLSDDETRFKTISPGGYFKYSKNNVYVKAESNLRGEIDYTITDGGNKLTMDDQGKILVAEAVKEMIAWGFDADGRMERVYQRGGVRALLSEVDSMKTDQVKSIYLSRLFAVDTIATDLPVITKKIGSMGSDMDKVRFLTKINPEQLKNPQTADVYFEIVDGLNSDMEKLNALRYFINQDSVSEKISFKILSETASLNSDMDKSNFYQIMIDKGLIQGPLIDNLVENASKLNADIDKSNVYKKIINASGMSESQWILLIDKISNMSSDMDKSNMLVLVAEKMPKTEPLKASYRKTAKSLNNDMDYGRAMRALE